MTEQVMEQELTGTELQTVAERLLDSSQELADIIQGLLTRNATLDNKVARLEHHFVTLDKQLSKQARRIEELEALEKGDRDVLELMKPVVMDMALRETGGQT